MKKLIIAATLLLSANAFADNLRDVCENAYYASAGGVTTLHQYRVTVNWGKNSDFRVGQIEDQIYGENAPLVMVSEKNWTSSFTGNLMSSYVMKENKAFGYRDFVIALEDLESEAGVSVNCM